MVQIDLLRCHQCSMGGWPLDEEHRLSVMMREKGYVV